MFSCVQVRISACLFLTDLLSQLLNGGFDIGANYMQVKSNIDIAVFSEKTDVPHLPNQSVVAISDMKL